ncbi:helix-turn-helix domain-containing protein [Agrobacterium fabrum]|uniref:helix-turn-helix domain-containing protein n=1 Tax=Agrobacterium fabrum TaxID=1176649 RepID=UPI000DD2E489|nr:helix-turn-helix transcriptional regulator [Agrobacterium fabrum]WCK77537.1 helix-turn-helix transcriptional regulator [Agrobacterium fabrum]
MLPVQCRMARIALEWGVRELAEAADVSTNTVTRFEKGDELKQRTVDAMRTAMEAMGIVFVEAGDIVDGYGVTVRSNE